MQPLLQTLHADLQAFERRRLEHVIHRRMLERRDREVVVRGDEDEERFGLVVGPLVSDDLGDFQACLARHLDVQEHHIGRQGLGQLDRLQAIVGDAHDLQLGPGFVQQALQCSRQHRFVFGNHAAPRAHDGILTTARTPHGDRACRDRDARKP
ncbi:hypothetical protein D9M69_585130 [compost metagenome]